MENLIQALVLALSVMQSAPDNLNCSLTVAPKIVAVDCIGPESDSWRQLLILPSGEVIRSRGITA